LQASNAGDIESEGEHMNCCNDFGDCNQGRNCPVRVAKIGKRVHGPELLPQSVWRYMLRRAAWWFVMGILGMLWLAFLVACAAVYA
jgi:hypothetical protein